MPFGSLPTGSFSSAFAGRLQIQLIAKFFANSYVDAGFPNTGGGSGNLSIRGYAGPSGTPSYTAVMDKYNAGTVGFEIDYPGGSVAWPCGVEEVGFKDPGGLYSIGFEDIQLVLRLKKK